MIECRDDCGACCVAPSIAIPFFGMPRGKPAGEACVHLTAERRCAIFDDPRRPDLCSDFMPEPAVCGGTRRQAMTLLEKLEVLSLPGGDID